MRKRTFAAAVLAVAAIGIIWNKVDNQIQAHSESAPAATASVGASASAVSATPGPSASASDKPVLSTGSSASSTPDPSSVIASDPPSDAAAFETLLAANLPANNVQVNARGTAVVTNAASTLVLVNKKRELPSTYIPDDLVVPNVPFSFSGDSPKKQLRKVAADALEELFAAADKDGIKLAAVSGYRSYATQKSLFKSNADKKGADVANQTSAIPGQSEHQTGLAMDVSSKSVNYALEPTFADTKEGQWLAKHAEDYGFIIRFLKGKEDVTGYSYEPWHVRYVGVDAAKEIMDRNITLEEYFDTVAASLSK